MNFQLLAQKIEGELYTDIIHKIIYATDASAYRELPIAVAYPKSNNDIVEILRYANKYKIGIIPRAAGTSLAGQCVGKGMVVDISRYMTQIIEINSEEKWVRVQPGVVLDELNCVLKPLGLFFGPETSTSNRCMVGGMVGNNACGAHSLIYGSTRDHLLEVKGVLSDGNQMHFKELSKKEFEDKTCAEGLEGQIYRHISTILSDENNQKNIRQQYPDPSNKRRNTGYAIDLLLETEVFTEGKEKFNFSKLIAGSEGTLMFLTEIKLNLVDLPPKEKAVVCIHFETLEQAIKGNLIALKYKPGAIELIDDIILNCTKDNIEQRKNRFFINGNPGAIIVVEWARETKEEIDLMAHNMEQEMRQLALGYHFPVLYGSDINKVWALRKAALGLLSNLPGDAKPVSLIEDTAVSPYQLDSYMADIKQMLKKNDLTCVFHAHIATGELHLRPVLNLKDPNHLQLFRQIATETAHIVKKYRGSLSGEHGDGRLRGEFIPIIIGQHNYELCIDLKKTWDPDNILNPGKITHTPPMDQSLRYEGVDNEKEFKTYFDFSESQGILRMAEKCNGSGDCRKTEIIGGTMCPSYMATRHEKNTTRARANMLREVLSRSGTENPYDNKELYQIFDLCLSCKACKSECPSGVDVAKLKAEFLQQYYDIHGVPVRSWLVANFTKINQLGALLPSVYNFFVSNKLTAIIVKKTIGFSTKRKLPQVSNITFEKWAKKNLNILNKRLVKPQKEIYLFVDEFTNYNESQLGIKACMLLNKLDYKIYFVQHLESGRTYLSKGLVKKAQIIARKNVEIFSKIVNTNCPLVGIEPSAILTFRDEYIDLMSSVDMKNKTQELAKNVLLFDEFIANEFDKGNIDSSKFTQNIKNIKIHGHCQQKSIASTQSIKKMLSIPQHYKVEEIPSGCCGMAGSFGFEKEHYQISMKIGELVLFPAIRKTSADIEISASGTSCRQQITDGTGKKALHPIEILYEALL